MYQSAEARPGPSQASKINLYARIVNVFKPLNVSVALIFGFQIN